VVFEFWLKIFGVAFGLGVVSGVVMAFEFGTNWSELSRMSGPIQGPLLSYETFTAFFLEASFFGILLFGRSRVPPWFYLFSTAMVALGTTLSAFWIMVNNSWMQVPVGYTRWRTASSSRSTGRRSCSAPSSGCVSRTCCWPPI
jgi:cytochrome d ubiquinol oxidase subunit I